MALPIRLLWNWGLSTLSFQFCSFTNLLKHGRLLKYHCYSVCLLWGERASCPPPFPKINNSLLILPFFPLWLVQLVKFALWSSFYHFCHFSLLVPNGNYRLKGSKENMSLKQKKIRNMWNCLAVSHIIPKQRCNKVVHRISLPLSQWIQNSESPPFFFKKREVCRGSEDIHKGTYLIP